VLLPLKQLSNILNNEPHKANRDKERFTLRNIHVLEPLGREKVASKMYQFMIKKTVPPSASTISSLASLASIERALKQV